MSTRFRAMQHRNFQLFIGGQLVSLIGTWMQSTAQLWLVYKMTGSAALLGVFGFANQVPILFLASIGGYVGDRYNRHHGVIITQLVSMLLAFALAALTFAQAITVWEIIVIAFLVGVVNAFDVPIRQAFLVQMVVREDLPNAIALNSSIFNGARVVGPAIAGFALAWKGPGWCFLLNGFSFLAVLAALLAMRIQKFVVKSPEGSPFQNFIQGFRFAMSDMPVRSALLLLSLLSLLGLAIFGFPADFRQRHSSSRRQRLRPADERRGSRRRPRRAIFRRAHQLQRPRALDRRHSPNYRRGPDNFFAIPRVLVFRVGLALRRLRRDGADGRHQHHRAKPRSR